ncbi:hypothetical protein O5D80_006030 [Batrachochytrium dendrobatidis]|nr:hypothetical protein O5D80_006030 [Batrachochytrium dendrobatidis]
MDLERDQKLKMARQKLSKFQKKKAESETPASNDVPVPAEVQHAFNYFASDQPHPPVESSADESTTASIAATIAATFSSFTNPLRLLADQSQMQTSTNHSMTADPHSEFNDRMQPIDSLEMETVSLSNESGNHIPLSSTGFTQPSFQFDYSKSKKRSKYAAVGIAGFGMSDTKLPPTADHSGHSNARIMPPIVPPMPNTVTHPSIPSHHQPYPQPYQEHEQYATIQPAAYPVHEDVTSHFQTDPSWTHYDSTSKSSIPTAAVHTFPTEYAPVSSSNSVAPAAQPSPTVGIETYFKTNIAVGNINEISSNSFHSQSIPGVDATVIRNSSPSHRSDSPIPFLFPTEPGVDPFASISGNIHDTHIDEAFAVHTNASPVQGFYPHNPPLAENDRFDTNRGFSVSPSMKPVNSRHSPTDSTFKSAYPPVATLPVQSFPETHTGFNEISEHQFDAINAPSIQYSESHSIASERYHPGTVENLQVTLDAVTKENIGLHESQQELIDKHIEAEDRIVHLKQTNLELEERMKLSNRISPKYENLSALTPMHLQSDVSNLNNDQENASTDAYQKQFSQMESDLALERQDLEQKWAQLEHDRHEFDSWSSQHCQLIKDDQAKAELRFQQVLDRENEVSGMADEYQRKMNEMEEVVRMRTAQAIEQARELQMQSETMLTGTEKGRDTIGTDHIALANAKTPDMSLLPTSEFDQTIAQHYKHVEAEREKVEILVEQLAQDRKALEAERELLHQREEALGNSTELQQILEQESAYLQDLRSSIEADRSNMRDLERRTQEQIAEYKNKYSVLEREEAIVKELKDRANADLAGVEHERQTLQAVIKKNAETETDLRKREERLADQWKQLEAREREAQYNLQVHQQTIQEQSLAIEQEKKRLATLEASLHATIESKHGSQITEMRNHIDQERKQLQAEQHAFSMDRHAAQERDHAEKSRLEADRSFLAEQLSKMESERSELQAKLIAAAEKEESMAQLEAKIKQEKTEKAAQFAQKLADHAKSVEEFKAMQAKTVSTQLAEHTTSKESLSAIEKQKRELDQDRIHLDDKKKDLDELMTSIQTQSNQLAQEKADFEKEKSDFDIARKQATSDFHYDEHANNSNRETYESIAAQLKAALDKNQHLERLLMEQNESLIGNRMSSNPREPNTRRPSLSVSISSQVDERVNFLENKVNCVMEAEEDMRMLLQQNMEIMDKLRRQMNPNDAGSMNLSTSIPSMAERLSRTDLRSAYSGVMEPVYDANVLEPHNSQGILQAVADYTRTNLDGNRTQVTSQQRDEASFGSNNSTASQRHLAPSDASRYMQLGETSRSSMTKSAQREPGMISRQTSYDSISQRYQSQNYRRLEPQRPSSYASNYAGRSQARTGLDDMGVRNATQKYRAGSGYRGGVDRYDEYRSGPGSVAGGSVSGSVSGSGQYTNGLASLRLATGTPSEIGSQTDSVVYKGDNQLDSDRISKTPSYHKPFTTTPHQSQVSMSKSHNGNAITNQQQPSTGQVKGLGTYFSSTDLEGFSDATRRILLQGAIGTNSTATNQTHTSSTSAGGIPSSSERKTSSEDIRQQVRRRLQERDAAKAASAAMRPW